MKLCIPEAILNQHAVVLGKTGAGKSSALRHIVEHLLREKKRVCIIDPKGDWWGLKSSADGNRAGFPVIAFGDFKNPEASDVPINAHSGRHVAELITSGNRPCVIGFRGWMTAHMVQFWIDFASGIFNANSGELYLVGDEFHNFAPKGKIIDPQAGKCLHWSNRLLSEGRGLGIVCLLASQRPQKVHNDTLTSCETLVAMRVVHAADRQAVADWIDGCGDKTQGKEVLAKLAGLPRGEAFVWSPEAGYGPQQVKFPMFTTFDSFAPPQLQKKVHAKTWAGVDLDAVKEKLATVIEEAKANDPKELRAENERLRRTLQEATTDFERRLKTLEANEVPNVPVITPEDRHLLMSINGWFTQHAVELDQFQEKLAEHVKQVNQHYREIASCDGRISKLLATTNAKLAKRQAQAPLPATGAPAAVVRQEKRHSVHTSNGTLSAMQRAILTALAQHPKGLTKAQVLIHAGYASSGPVSSCFGQLNRDGWMTADGNAVRITDAGLEALGHYEPLPTGAALRAHLLNGSKLSTMEKALLGVIFDVYPQAIRKGEILERTGYASSGPVSSAFGKLVKLNYARPHGASTLVAADEFFN